MTLLCAATKWEARPLAKTLGLEETIPGVFERKDGNVALLQTGMGREKTAKALREWRAAAKGCGAVVSTGFCGALQPGMRTGDIVADLGGCDMALVQKARETAERLGLRIHFGKVAHNDAVLSSPARKKELGRTQRASAVDMETSAVRDWALGAGATALCLRVVLDGVDQSLPEALPEGEDFFSLLRYVFGNLGQAPLLVLVGYRQRLASASLCRFLGAYLEVS